MVFYTIMLNDSISDVADVESAVGLWNFLLGHLNLAANGFGSFAIKIGQDCLALASPTTHFGSR
jgi:hypothetical protein